MFGVKGKAGGGSSKRRAGGGGSDAVVRKTALQTPGDALIRLRCALRNEDGSDKDPLAGIAAPLLRVQLEEACATIASAFRLSDDEIEWAVAALRSSASAAATAPAAAPAPSAAVAFGTSSFGTAAFGAQESSGGARSWNDQDEDEALELLGEEGARFLVARDERGALVGLVNFRFSLTGEAVGEPQGKPCIFLHHIIVDEASRRRGLAKRMLAVLEMAASRNSMECVLVAVPLERPADAARTLLESRSYALDEVLTGNAAAPNRGAAAAADGDDYVLVEHPENLPDEDGEDDGPEFKVFSDMDFYLKAVRPKPFTDPAADQTEVQRLAELITQRLVAQQQEGAAASAPAEGAEEARPEADGAAADLAEESGDSSAPASPASEGGAADADADGPEADGAEASPQTKAGKGKGKKKRSAKKKGRR